ncbi:MAG: hypothetical protein OEN56_12695 [Gemmatimonadota bacterium]|nr:hypothetical protein [Gemmatimonadota bacterium]
MDVFVGVDGGGTTTRAVVVDEDLGELGRAEVAGSVVTVRDPGPAAEAVAAAVREAAATAGVGLPVAGLWAGLAGAGAEVPNTAVTARLEAEALARHLRVGTDVEAAFHDAFPSGPGVMLVAGTGSIVWSRNPSGETHRVGGWGQQLGDEGSGYWIGLEGLRLVVRAEDGRLPETTLRAGILRHCGASSVSDLVAWVNGAHKSEVAALVPVVVGHAKEGDVGAGHIIDRAVSALTEQVRAAVDEMDGSRANATVVLWGGLVASGGPLEDRVRAALVEMGVACDPRSVDPPMGAARLARELVRSHRGARPIA